MMRSTSNVLKLAEIFSVHSGYFMGARAMDSPFDPELTDLPLQRTQEEIVVIKAWLRLLK
ncbi:MAG: hypothetical protein WD848_00555 [Dehalococcoidia bacterium]